MESLDSQEITEWMAFEDADGPLGAKRLDYLAGVIASGQVNVWKGRDEKPLGPLDLIEDWGNQRARAEEHAKEQRRRLDEQAWQQWAELYGEGME